MRTALIVLLAFVVLAVGLTWPLAAHAGSAVEDRLDALLNTWILAWDGHQLLTDPLHLFDANIFFPYQNTLAFSEIILPQALAALPVTLATANPVLGYNGALLLSFVLSGFAAYLFVLRMTRSRWAGLAAGIVFAFNAYKLSNLAQAQLLALQWLPLALLYLDRTALARTRDGHSVRDAALLAIFVALQALSSFYYALLTAIAVVLWLLAALALQRRSLSAGGLMRVASALALAALLVLPFVLPYLQVEQELGFRRTVEESIPFSASLAQYGQALPGNIIYGRLAASTPTVIGSYPLDALFPGAGVLLLAMLGILQWGRRPGACLFALVLVAVSFVLSLGPTLTLSPGQSASLPLSMPYRWLYALPGFQALRAPVRCAALLFLGLALLAGLGVARLSAIGHRVRGRSLWGSLAALLFAVAVTAEAVTVPAAATATVPAGSDVPAVYNWLSEQEAGVILELPMIATPAERGLLNQYFSIYHWQATPDGYSGFIPPKHGEIAYEMQLFPSERSLSLLQGLGVRHLVVHTDLVADWEQREKRLGTFSADIASTQRFGDTVVFRVLPRASTSEGMQPHLFLPATAQSRSSYTASLVVTNSGQRSAVTKPTERTPVEITWRTATNEVVKSEGQTITLPLVVSQATVVPIVCQAPDEGTYSLTVKVRLPQGAETGEAATVRVEREALPQAQAIAVRLAGGSADKAGYRPGDTALVSLQWDVLGKVDAYYSSYVRLLDKNGQALVQVDGPPAGNSLPTLLWTPGQAISKTWSLVIPSAAPAGRYTLETAFYRPEDLSPRLTLGDNGHPVQRLILGTVRVASPLTVAGIPALRVNASFGDKAALTGYDIEGCAWSQTLCVVQPGSTLRLTLYWESRNEMADDYTVFVHLADASGKPLAQDDARPRGGQYPTSVWQKGDVVTDSHTITVPSVIPAGSYTLLTGMYDPATGTRLPTGSQTDTIPLVSVVVR